MIIDPDLAAAAACDDKGIPKVGRRRELAALRQAGYRNLAFGRIYEGHVNALQLIARCGSPAQRARARTESAVDLMFGVWNTEDAEDGVSIEQRLGRYVLSGSKTWCSGAGTIARPIVTARRPDGASQMCIVPTERVQVAIDSSGWHPLGMHDSASYRVAFDGCELAADDLLGNPGDYERAPWFLGGAIRFVAVQTGGIERLTTETARYLVDHNRDADPMQTARVAHMYVATQSARNWLDVSADAWSAFDDESEPAANERAVTAADMARYAVERHALDVIENAQRCVGARGLVEPFPFAALCRDLQMYLRQPAPDAAVVRVGRVAFAEAIARRSPSSAESTGTIG
ncbi:MAG: hypothetical protein NVSMB5_05740 [Candidatus Velthaea sp.]